jgi:AraC family transcriptional regulator
VRSFKSLFKAVKSIFQIRAARRSNPGKTRVLALFSVFIFSRKFTRFHAALKPIFRSLKPFQAFSSLFNLRARVFSFYMNTYTGAQRRSSQPRASRRRRNSRRWPCGAHRGRRQNGNASHFAAKNERTRRVRPCYDGCKELIWMEWLDRMNDALGYLEANLAGTADMEHAARLACCSVYHFGRMFSYIAGVPLSEYLRRRRMTLAAFDLQNGGRVLDVALRYGYESPTAFNRAFQSVHGVSPSAAQRDGAPLKAYPRISFKITVKGEAEMDYRIIKQEAFRIVGVREPLLPDFEDSFRRVPEFWGEAAASGTIPRLCLLMDAAPKGILGVSTCMPDAENYYYIAVASTRPAPEGMHEYVVPACTWAVFPGRGSMPAAMQELQKRVVSEWLPGSGYEWGQAPDLEVYLDDGLSGESSFEVWLPVAKR